MDFELRPTILAPSPIDPLLRRRQQQQWLSAGPVRPALRTRSSAGERSPAASARRRGRRLNAVVFALASAVGLWLGFGAAAVSPVTPLPPTASAVPTTGTALANATAAVGTQP